MLGSFMKKQSAGFYAGLLAIVFAIVSLIIYIVNSNNDYFKNLNGTVVILTVAAIVIQAAALGAAQISKDSTWIKTLLAVCMVATSILLFVSLGLFLRDRVYDMAIVFGSDLERGNDLAFAAMNQAIVGIVFYCLAAVSTIVGSFFKITKQVK